MKRVILLSFILLISLTSTAQSTSITGRWKTIDDKTGEAKSIVEIYQKGDTYFGKIVDIINPQDRDKTCLYCEGDDYNKPLIGLEIIKGLTLKDNFYEGGTIFDPEKGNTYKAKIWVDQEDPARLNVRGYVAFFFRTQQWIRSQ